MAKTYGKILNIFGKGKRSIIIMTAANYSKVERVRMSSENYCTYSDKYYVDNVILLHKELRKRNLSIPVRNT